MINIDKFDDKYNKFKGEKMASKLEKNNTIKQFLTIKETAEYTGLHPNTLRRLADNQKIICYKTPSGQRRFNKADLAKMCAINNTNTIKSAIDKQNIIYARVSSKKQLDDLDRQIEYLRNKKTEYATYNIIKDCASGINFKRPGLLQILDFCIQGSIGEVIVAHKDRLARFGFELLKLFIEKNGGSLKIIDEEEHKSTEQELADDLLSIIHIYSCRQMGKRRYTRSRKDTNEINTNQTET
jgi:putative resolvase